MNAVDVHVNLKRYMAKPSAKEIINEVKPQFSTGDRLKHILGFECVVNHAITSVMQEDGKKIMLPVAYYNVSYLDKQGVVRLLEASELTLEKC